MRVCQHSTWGLNRGQYSKMYYLIWMIVIVTLTTNEKFCKAIIFSFLIGSINLGDQCHPAGIFPAFVITMYVPVML